MLVLVVIGQSNRNFHLFSLFTITVAIIGKLKYKIVANFLIFQMILYVDHVRVIIADD